MGKGTPETTARIDLEAKDFLTDVLIEGKAKFVLPEDAPRRAAILRELGTGYSHMGNVVNIGFQKRAELRDRLARKEASSR